MQTTAVVQTTETEALTTESEEVIEVQSPVIQEITTFLGGMVPYESKLGDYEDIQIFFVLESGRRC